MRTKGSQETKGPADQLGGALLFRPIRLFQRPGIACIEEDVHFYDDVTPYDESESRAVLGLVEVNLDALLTDFHAMSHDWKRGRLMERWGVRGWSPDDFFEEIRRRHHADLE